MKTTLTINSLLKRMPADLIQIRLGENEALFFEAEPTLNEYFGLAYRAHLPTMSLELGEHPFAPTVTVDGNTKAGELLELEVDVLLRGFVGTWVSQHPASDIAPAERGSAFRCIVAGQMRHR